MKHKESLISAHHNYLINNTLSPGFVLGDPNSKEGFYFLADFVLPGESTPRISARLFDTQALFLLELNWNRIVENPNNCPYQSTPGGFRILYPSGEPLLEVDTQTFPLGYLTRIQGKLFDGEAKLRMEPSYDGSQVYGETNLALDVPFQFSKR